jgi:hypothetical protein
METVSPEDRISRYNQRLGDYRGMAIQNIWLIDPATQVAFDCRTAAWLLVDEFKIGGTPISLRLTEMWNELKAGRQ